MADFAELLKADTESNGILSRTQSGDFKDAADWLAEPDEPETPLVAKFIEIGEVFAMVGQAKAGKSLIALQLAVCIASGSPFLGMECARRRVYVGNLEVSAKQYKKRLRRICRGMNLNPDTLRGWLFIDNMKGETADWDTALAMCKANECGVAIIDPFYQIARIVETDEAQCLDAVEKMKQFTLAGITLGIVFHSPKGFSGDRQLIDMISGSSILARFPESVIGLLNHATEKTARVVDAVLRNYAPPQPFAVTLESGVLELAPELLPDVASARNAYLRKKIEQPAVDVLPYVEKAITEMREDAKRTGTPFKGVKKGVLVEKVRNLIKADGKPAQGRDATTNLIEGLPPDKVIITKKTAEGVLIGMPEDMRWYAAQ